MTIRLSIPRTMSAEFLKELADIRSPAIWAQSLDSEDEELQTIIFADDKADAVNGALTAYDEEWLRKRKTEQTAAVDAERDRRIEGGFMFMGVPIQSAQSDRENVIGLAVAAMGALGQGAQPGDLQWLKPGMDFGFITADNTVIPLDAMGMMALYQTGLAFKLGNTLYARGLKDAMLATTTLAELEAIPIDLGWPE